MGVLVTIILIAVVAYLWSRLNKLQQRVDELELAEFHTNPADIRTWDEPEPAPRPAEDLAVPLVFEQELPPDEPFNRPADLEDSAEPENFPEVEPETRKFGFEDIFGRRLPIWAGGITLAVAGMLIVKYSIDAGLVSPLVRVVSGLIFGSALIGTAELALRVDVRVRDPRVRQALAGAGVASLYGAILIAANVYDLIGPVTAFLGMAAVTAMAMGLSLRFGAPSALLGLAGGLAAPALVGSGEPNIPLLASYLALAVGGLSVLSKSQRWMWLGVAALTGGFGWAGILLLSGTLDAFASISLALYIILLGVVLPMVIFSGRLGNAVRVAGSIAAAAQMAGLVATGGFTLLHWGLFGLISAAILWLATRDERLVRLPAVGLAIALLLLLAWPEPTTGRLAIVMVFGATLYGVPPLLALWRARGTMLEAAEISALGVAGLIVPMFHFFRLDGSNDTELALVGLGAGLIPAGAAALGWNSPDRRDDARFAVLATTAAVLIAAAAALALPSWSLAPIVGLLGLGLVTLSLRAEDPRVETSGWSLIAASLPLLTLGFHAEEEFGRLLGIRDGIEVAIALARWGGLAAIFASLSLQARPGIGRDIAQASAALLAYGAIAQLMGGNALPILSALAVAALAQWSRQLRPNKLLPALATLLTVSFLWAAGPLLHWAAPAAASLFAYPMLVSSLPTVQDTVLRLLVPAALITSAWWLTDDYLFRRARSVTLTIAGVMGVIALHVLFKQLWSIESMSEFVQFGMAERISWEALLLASALIAWHFGQPKVAFGLTAAGLAHFAWYSMVVHNPLLWEQAVGSLPLANLLLLAYGIPLLWLWLLERRQPAMSPMLDRIRSDAPMLLIFLFAFSSLRQLFQGSILTGGGVTEWEDIFRSVIAIVLAIGFLTWGIRSGSRDWRIASLAIMIVAVAKVFLLDASQLDGLLRIASFVALGLSLIGIGWLYSRYLGENPKPLLQM